MGAIIANLFVIALACALLSVSPAPRPKRIDKAAIEPSRPTLIRLVSRPLPQETIRVRTSRHVSVVELPISVGDHVTEGTPLVVLRDLALVEKRAEVSAEFRRLQAGIGEVQAQTAAVEEAESRARLEAIGQIEAEYQALLKDFERFQRLFDEGLLARIEYEQHKRDLEFSRAQAEAAHESIDRPSAPDAPEAIEGLGAAERMLARLETLPEEFVLTASRDGVVEEIFVSVGDSPARGTDFVLLREERLARVSASLPAGVRVSAVIEVCGAPGRFSFEIVDETVFVEAPQIDESSNQSCDVVIELARSVNKP